MSLARARELLVRARAARIGSNRASSGTRVGRYASRFKGSGIEFADLRLYVPGDDVRSIDWNVTARSDDVFVREYVEERNRTIVLAFDVSGSASFGSERSKRDAMLEAAAAIIVGALDAQDRFAAVTFADRIETRIAPGSGEEHALRVLASLCEEPVEERATDLDRVLTALARLSIRGGVYVVLSDFDAPPFDRALRRLALSGDVVGVRVLDPVERELPLVGAISLIDPESGEEFTIDASDPDVRSAFDRIVAEADERVRSAFLSARSRLVDIEADPVRDLERVEVVG